MEAWKLYGSLLVLMLLLSCAASDKELTPQVPMPQLEVGTSDEGLLRLYVDTEASRIGWSGSKMMGTHHGTIDIAIGTVLLDGSELKGGNFIIDMNTIENLDLKGTWPHDGLLEHLRSDEFFHVDSFPAAIFKMTDAQHLESDTANYLITGELTIKGITNNITFPANVNATDSTLYASGSLVIDRSRWDVRFGSKTFYPELLPIKTISNDIGIEIVLVAGEY